MLYYQHHHPYNQTRGDKPEVESLQLIIYSITVSNLALPTVGQNRSDTNHPCSGLSLLLPFDPMSRLALLESRYSKLTAAFMIALSNLSF